MPERTKEREIHVKVGSDSESDEDAARLLGHAASATTRKHYRAKPDIVKPLTRGKARQQSFNQAWHPVGGR